MSRRDREYTPEEAHAIILREVTPHWYHSEPLVVGIEAKTPYPQPLTPKIKTGAWVLFFVSATSPVFDRVLEMMRVWERRFSSLGVRFIFCFRGDYSFFNERKAIEAWLKKLEIPHPCVCDVNGVLAKAFGADAIPAVAILDEGQIAYSGAGEGWLRSAEETVQKILRKDSPGLPLWPVYLEQGHQVVPKEKWFLRKGSDGLHGSRVTLLGNWVIEDDRVVTSDPKAELSFKAPGGAVEIVARSLSDVGDPTRIRFDTQGASFSGEFAGKDFAVDAEGNSSILLGGPRAYSALRNLTPALRKLRFRFPFAKVSPVAIYGFEFGD